MDSRTETNNAHTAGRKPFIIQSERWHQAKKYLVGYLANTITTPDTNPTTLSLNEISILPSLFQARYRPNDSMIRDMVRALRDKRAKHLPPITVFWLGNKWCCIDGHHRLQAYQNAKVKTAIPVMVFQPTKKNAEAIADEVIAQSLSKNSITNTPLTLTERQESAWRLVTDSALSKAQIAEATNISERNVAYMRVAKGKIETQYPDISPQSLPWWQARRFVAEGTRPNLYEECPQQDKIRALAERVRKSPTINRLASDPWAAARALMEGAPDFAKALSAERHAINTPIAWRTSGKTELVRDEEAEAGDGWGIDPWEMPIDRSCPHAEILSPPRA